MSATYLISDTHFGHEAIYHFTDKEGHAVRPIESAVVADEYMVERWNTVVKENDKVYHLGDVALRRKSLDILGRLNGRKVLIRGNHDIYKIKDYLRFFNDVRGSWKIDRFILSHYPIALSSIPYWCLANIHGHTHGQGPVDSCYYDVSVEATGYAPVSFDLIKERYRNE